MAEEGELRLIQGDVAAQVLDDAYGRKEPEFLQFVECFSTGKTDEGIEDMIKRLYAFSVSYPYPEEWLLSCKEAYQHLFRGGTGAGRVDADDQRGYPERVCRRP